MIEFVPRSYRESVPVIISYMYFNNLERDAEGGESEREREREDSCL
jgi:hypothetical protein